MNAVRWLRATLWAVLALVVVFMGAAAWDVHVAHLPEAEADLFGPGFHAGFVTAAAMVTTVFGGVPAAVLLLALRLGRRAVSFIALAVCALLFVALLVITVIDGWNEAWARLVAIVLFGGVMSVCGHPDVRRQLGFRR
jgi:MFS family permease